MLTFEAGKRYVTRGGEHGLLVSNIVPGAFPLLFLPDGPGNLFFPKREDGGSISDPVYDLVSEEVTPEPVYWSKPEHVPGPVCWIRNRNHGGCSYMVTEFSPDGACFGGTEAITPWSLMNQFEYSTDRKTWKPCTVAP